MAGAGGGGAPRAWAQIWVHAGVRAGGGRPVQAEARVVPGLGSASVAPAGHAPIRRPGVIGEATYGIGVYAASVRNDPLRQETTMQLLDFPRVSPAFFRSSVA